jgi:uncharacterized protein YdaL
VSATPGETNVYWTKKIGNGAETTITKSDATKYQGQTVQAPGLIILNTDTDFKELSPCSVWYPLKTGDLVLK